MDRIAAGDEFVGHGDVVHGFDPAITIAKEHGLAREARPVVADGVIGALLKKEGRASADIHRLCAVWQTSRGVRGRASEQTIGPRHDPSGPRGWGGLVAEGIGDLEQNPRVRLAHIAGRGAAIAVPAELVFLVFSRLVARRQDDQVRGQHLDIPAEELPRQRDRGGPVEELEKGGVLDDAVAHVELAALFEPAGVGIARIEGIGGLVELGECVGRQGIFDEEIALLFKKCLIFGGEDGLGEGLGHGVHVFQCRY